MVDTNQKELSCSGREKHWSELTDTERIHRLRTIVKRQREELGRLIDTVYRLREHEHNQQGKLLVPLQHNEPGFIRRDVEGDDVYF